jgi:hypothetical protein
MKHLLDIIESNGYSAYGRSIIFPEQNSSAKEQNNMILKLNKNIVFTEGDSNSLRSTFYYRKNRNEITTMKPGGISVYFIKNNDFENPIIWGLSESELPPTLIYPRPKIKIIEKDDRFMEGYNIIFNDRDKAMNICLNKEEHQLIFDVITGKIDKEFQYSI